MAGLKPGDRVEVTHGDSAFNGKVGTVLNTLTDRERIRQEWGNWEGETSPGHVWVWLDKIPSPALKDVHSWQFREDDLAPTAPTAEELAEVYKSLGIVNKETA